MEDKHVVNNRLSGKFYDACRAFAGSALIWLILILLFSAFEIVFNSITHGFQTDFFSILIWSFLFDIFYWLRLFLFLLVIYTVLYIYSEKFAKVFFQVAIVILLVIHACLFLYFNSSLVLLGGVLYNYHINDIKQTLGASGGVSLLSISSFVILILIVISALHFLYVRIKIKRIPALILPALSLLYLITGVIATPNLKTDFENNLVLNKSDYFFRSSYTYFFPEKFEIDIYDDSYIGDNEGSGIDFVYVDEVNYPFLHKDASRDVLSPFFQSKDSPPNIVILLAEGLGRAYSNDEAYLGSFTPFLDSLSKQSLYWSNTLSQGGRTFAVLPSILGSLPFTKNGFLELEKMPDQLSLLNLLKFNGYHTSFYYGGDAVFDRMERYLKVNKADEIIDENDFPAGYLKLPSINGFNWGYNDKELFRFYLANHPVSLQGKPQLSVILTVATHNPFLINEPDKYAQLFEKKMSALKLDESGKRLYRKYKDQYASILYLDDAIRIFFREYKKRADFENTIFIITGDHRMPEIPMSTKIDRYHVPMLIYSQLLKRRAEFSSVSSHFDIPPTILAYLKNNHKIKLPALNSWIGEGLDTGRNFRNLHRIPLMQNKTDIIDFVRGEYHLNGDDLFKLNPVLGEEKIDDDSRKNQLVKEFNLFKKRNTVISNGGKIIPDTLYKNYTPQE